MFHTIVSIKNDGHYFCRAGGNRPDGLNEPVTEKIGSQKNYRCLAGGIGGVVITEIYCAVIVHIKGMASSELYENILSGDSLVVRIIPALLAGVVMDLPLYFQTSVIT